MHVLDASVAIKWFVADEVGRDEALSILDDVRDSPRQFAVPELFYNEMLALLARLLKRDDAALLQAYVGALQDLGFERIGNGRELLSCAAEIASQYRLSGYDAIYAASANLVGGQWLTADRRAHNKVRHLRISKAVCLK